MSDRTTPHFHRGAWAEVPESSLLDLGPGGDFEESLAAGGWEIFAQFGNDATGLGIAVYRRWSGPDPRFLVEVSTSTSYDYVAATDFADAMEVLSRWTPLVQYSLLGQIAGDAEASLGQGDRYNLISRLGARLRMGWDQLPTWEGEERKPPPPRTREEIAIAAATRAAQERRRSR